jgi:hypothetical protein
MMETITSQLPEQKNARRLAVLARLSEQGQLSEEVTRSVDKFLAYEAAQTRTLLEQLQADLRVFEQQYHLSSAEFYQQHRTGKTDDCMDFVEWASLIQMAENAQKRLALLTEDKA